MTLLFRFWRLAVAAGCFLLVGGGGLLYSLVAFPALRLLPGGRVDHERRVRALIRHSFVALVAILEKTRIMRMDVREIGTLREGGPVLVLANHPSYLDIVVLLALVPDACCVVKSALWSNPFFGGVVRNAGYVRNDDPASLVRQCTQSLATGRPLIIFPEGTRSVPGTPLRFVRGAARVALQSNAAIVPVLMRCDPPALPRGARWHDIAPRTFRLTLRAMPPTGAAALLSSAASASQPGARALTGALERLFAAQLENHERSAV